MTRLRKVLLTEPPRPRRLAARSDAPYFTLAAVCVGALIGQLDASIVTVALPTLERTYHASVGAVTWVTLSYIVVLVAGVTPIGHLADIVGRKLLYTYGFVVFAVGSALCALAPSLVVLDLARVVQAVGAAMLQANSVAIVYAAMPAPRLARGIGIQGAAQALGLALGPSVGALLLAAGGWRLIFLVNVPLGALGVVAALLLVPRSRDLAPRTPYDWSGLALFAPAVTAILIAVSFAGTPRWPLLLSGLLLACGAVLALRFTRHERRARHPMLDLALLRQPRLVAGLAGSAGAFVVLFGTMFLVPFFLERARGLGPIRVGAALSAMALALGITAPLAGRLSEVRGAGRLIERTGMLLSAGALLALGLAAPATWGVAALLVVVGVGTGMFIPLNSSTVMALAPRARAGAAGGILNMARGFGTAFGLAATALLYESVAGHGTGATRATAGARAAFVFLAAVALGVSVALLRTGRSGRPTPHPRRASRSRTAPGSGS